MAVQIRSAALWLARFDPTSAELGLSVSALMFGCALLVPVDLSVRSPAFRALVELAPQPVWAGVWLVVGTAQMIGATTGYRRGEADVLAACLWVFWTVIQLLWLGLTVGPFTYSWFAVSSIAASHLGRYRGTG